MIHICSTYIHVRISIEIRNYLDGEFQMTFDAKTIIPNLSVPLENGKN